MSDSLKIYCVNTQSYMPIEGGETLADIAGRLSPGLPFTPICAHVNNKTEDLSFPLFSPKMVEFLPAWSPSGRRVGIRTLCMILYKAVSALFPDATLRIEHSVSRGYYCRLLSPQGEPLPDVAAAAGDISGEMRRIVEADMPITRKERLTKDVVEMFRRQHLDDKVQLLESLHSLYTTFYRLDGINDSYYGPLASRTSLAPPFSLIPYRDGLLLLGPDAGDPTVAATPVPQDKMFDAFTQYQKFNRVIRVSNVGELNVAVRARKTAGLINAAEAMHDKLLGRISDDISRRRRETGGAKAVFIAGPSSSGKTTSAKRLAIQLMTNLMTPKLISLDDYFVDRDKTPLDADGDYDFESLHALDLPRFYSDLSRLFAGEEINLPTYSFELGRRVERPRPLRLNDTDVLLIEGIHGLNPELTASLPADDIYKVYVSALTTLHIDDHNWISTTDSRLLRRIVRDNKYRKTPAIETIRRWPSVRRGEEKWIFPFQENADATFNSSLIFELGVMKPFAEPLLREVPHDSPLYAEAFRLLSLLSYFEVIPADQIPPTSLLREFLGGSSFRY